MYVTIFELPLPQAEQTSTGGLDSAASIQPFGSLKILDHHGLQLLTNFSWLCEKGIHS